MIVSDQRGPCDLCKSLQEVFLAHTCKAPPWLVVSGCQISTSGVLSHRPVATEPFFEEALVLDFAGDFSLSLTRLCVERVHGVRGSFFHDKLMLVEGLSALSTIMPFQHYSPFLLSPLCCWCEAVEQESSMKNG